MENELTLLKELLEKHDFEKFESLLFDVVKKNDSNCISELISLFDDEFEYDEIMFSIIHAIESFDDETYTQQIIKSTPNLSTNSPRWYKMIISRINKNEETNRIYLLNLKRLNGK